MNLSQLKKVQLETDIVVIAVQLEILKMVIGK